MDRYHKLMHFSAIIALGLFAVVLMIQIFSIVKNNREMKAQLDEMVKNKEQLIKENAEYEDQLKYLSNEKNLEKELKSKFNYKNPGEEMMIIVNQ